MLADPAEARVAGGDEAVEEGGERGDEDEDEGAMAGDGADEGGGGHREAGGDHGQEARVGESLVGSEADGERAAAGDEAAAGVVRGEANGKAETDGGGADEGKAEVEGGPVEDVEVGEEGWRGARVGCGGCGGRWGLRPVKRREIRGSFCRGFGVRRRGLMGEGHCFQDTVSLAGEGEERRVFGRGCLVAEPGSIDDGLCGEVASGGVGAGVVDAGPVPMVDSPVCRVLRDVIPPTPPGPEGSNGNGLVWAQ